MDNFVASLFLEPTIQKIEMIHIAEYVAELFGVCYKKVYTIGKVEGKEKKTSQKYSQEELRKIIDADDYNIETLSFQNIKKVDGWPDTTISIDFVGLSEVDSPAKKSLAKIIVEIDPKTTEQNLLNLMNQVITYIHSIDIRVWYGIATMMEERKFPTFFFIGMATSFMTDEEKRIAHAMSCYRTDYQTKIWDIFEYNLVRKDIVSEKMMKGIKQVIGTERIREMDDFYIFTLMDDPEQMSLASSKIVVKRNKLRKIFEQEDRIMFRT